MLKGYTRGDKPITCRPGDVLECELEGVKEEAKDVAKTEEDRLICAMYPQTGKQFLAAKYGKGAGPKETEKAKTLEDVKAEDARIAEAKKKK